MLGTLITSRTRVRLLLKFFINSSTTSYLRDLESEFGESTNAIRVELNRFEEAGLLTSNTISNRKYFRANPSHPLFPDITNIVHKYVGLDRIIEVVTEKLGNLDSVYLTGSYAKGLENGAIELVLVGNDIDTAYMDKLVGKAKNLIKKDICYELVNESELLPLTQNQTKPLLLLWEA
jgi:hypothetical protein